MNNDQINNEQSTIIGAHCRLFDSGHAALMPYFPLGFPDAETSLDVITAMSAAGADAFEIGLSFSDPLADGPVIQHATQIALEKGITVKQSLAMIAELRCARRDAAVSGDGLFQSAVGLWIGTLCG